jgi:NADH-quinone oxidoreductase subunit L
MLSDLFWLIPLLPGAGALINGLYGKRLPRSVISAVACGSVGLSLFLALAAFFGVFWAEGGHAVRTASLFTWIPGMEVQLADGSWGPFKIAWEYRLDSLAMVMVLVVSGVGFLIHVYSVGYMGHDPGYWRYFAYLNLFTFFMLNLVLAANFLLMFIGWEGVGLCSYLLIGFWFERKSAADAGKKAFIVNRIGDAGFALAMMLIFVNFGSLDFYRVMGAISERFPGPEVGWGLLSAIGVLLFVGAAGKSAQIPLYVWLPDAMEGPTPVSALIHAATMVTAGVYMVARCGVLYEHAPAALAVVAVIGAATAIFAASIGLVQNDIKRVLAYSTVSQLGYMFLACGVGAFAAGIFHLMTHAFFKACLFLGSGSVIHAMEHAEHASGGHRPYTAMQDMRNMGGLFRHMPRTAWTFIIATAAIAGVPLTAGFFSKDEILWKAFSGAHGSLALWIVAVGAAAMTAFYMTRQVAMTFFGKFRGGEKLERHLHESPGVMTWPLILLAAGSVLAGYVGVPHAFFGSNRIEGFLEPAILAGTHAAAGAAAVHHEVDTERLFALFSILVAGAGIYLGYRFYIQRPEEPATLAAGWPATYRTLYNKYYVDELYDRTFVSGTVRGSEAFSAFDASVVDGAVNGTAFSTVSASEVSNFFDMNFVDGAVNLVASVLTVLSGVFRRLQTGLVQNYALVMLVGIFILVGIFYFMS